MVTFFVRRLAGMVVDAFLIGLLLYALLIQFPLPAWQPDFLICHDCSPRQNLLVLYAYDEPWPLNYMTWLFSPTARTVTLPPPGGIGGSVPAKDITLVQAGLLTGDFGSSWSLNLDTPVLALYGINLPFLLSLSFGMLLFFALIVAWQRRGRPHFYGFAPSTNPARAIYRHAEVWPLG